MEAVSLSEDTKNEMKTLRLNSEKTSEEIFPAVSKCAEQHGITITYISSHYIWTDPSSVVPFLDSFIA